MSNSERVNELCEALLYAIEKGGPVAIFRAIVRAKKALRQM